MSYRWRTLVLAIGAAATGVHAITALMLTPFFGATPWFWSLVLASLPVSIALGVTLGGYLVRRRRSGPSGERIAALSGLVVLCIPQAIGPVARALLDRNPDAALAPVLAVLLLITAPATGICAAIPGAMRPQQRKKKDAFSRGGLLLLALGGALGPVLTAPSLLRLIEVPLWTVLWGLGGMLLVASALIMRRLRPPFLAAGLALAGCLVSFPTEVRTYEYRRALERSWSLPVGRYYLDTARQVVLKETDVLRQYEALRSRLRDAPDRKVAAVIVFETLERMGAVQITGEGLRRLLELHLPEEAKPRVLPFFERVESVRSDGRGRIQFSLRWFDDDDDAIRVSVPTVDKETLVFRFRRDFELQIRAERDPDVTRSVMEIGPREVERAGFLEQHDTVKTPVEIEDVALMFDAYLIGLSVTTRGDRVVVRVRAQGAIGGVEEKVIQVIDLKAPPGG
ncbi:MAG: hypothetical protein ACYS22_13225 [Planctomycetota bacterium]